MATVNSHRCFVVRTGNSMKVISPERTKTCELSRILINTSPGITEEEHGLVDRLFSDLPDNVEDTADLTMEELKMIAEIRRKSNTYEQKPTVEVRTDHLGTTNNRIHNYQTAKAVNGAINSLNETERRIIGTQKVLDVYKEDFYQVEYDLPTVLTKLTYAKGGVDNPSDWFWQHAMRLTKSCWVFPESSFRHAEVTEWLDDARAKDCDIVVVKYSRDQIDMLKQRGIQQLSKAIREYHGLLLENIENADKELAEANKLIEERLGKKEIEDSEALAEIRSEEDYRNNKVRRHLKNAIERFKMTLLSAELFDMTENVSDLFTAFRESIRSRSEAFNAMAEVRKVKVAPTI